MNKILALATVIILFFTSCSNNESEQLPNNLKQDRNKFILSIESFKESNKISSELPNLSADNQKTQEKRMKSLIVKGIGLSKEVSDDYLKILHKDLPDNFRNKLVKSNELYLESLLKNVSS